MIVPRFPQDRCVIISDGGVESLLACAMASEQQHISGNDASILLPAWWEWTDEIDLMISAADPAIVLQASVFGLDIFPDQSVYPPDDEQSQTENTLGSIQSRVLLEAAQIALRAGIRRVVWPIRVMRPETTQTMDDLLDQIALTIDRSVLASRLASLDATDSTAMSVTIETPFVDLSNDQIVDLVSDMAIPLETCWWHNGRSLPHAKDRVEYWARINLQSPAQVEIKHQPQTQT